MATRGPPGARGMGNRFAQFKLVLLGQHHRPHRTLGNPTMLTLYR